MMGMSPPDPFRSGACRTPSVAEHTARTLGWDASGTGEVYKIVAGNLLQAADWYSALRMEPARVGQCVTAYHGTTRRFEQFSVGADGAHFGSLAQASHRLCSVTTRLPVDEFARLPTMSGGQPGLIVRAELVILKPKRIEDQRTALRWRKAIAQAKQEGFDSIVYRNDYEMPSECSDSWVVFEQVQIGALSYPFNDDVCSRSLVSGMDEAVCGI